MRIQRHYFHIILLLNGMGRNIAPTFWIHIGKDPKVVYSKNKPIIPEIGKAISGLSAYF